jgi:hypothetical protein
MAGRCSGFRASEFATRHIAPRGPGSRKGIAQAAGRSVTARA